MLLTLPLPSPHNTNVQPSLRNIEKHLPCGDISHYQPLFFPTTCHHPHKVLVADLNEGMGTLVHTGSKRNPAFGLWPLSHELVGVVRNELVLRELNGVVKSELEENTEPEAEVAATSLSAFLGEHDDADWEVVEAPPAVKEKFVLVGRPVAAN